MFVKNQTAKSIKAGMQDAEIGNIADVFMRFFNKAGVYGIIVLLAIVGTLVSDVFLTVTNFVNVLSAVALLGIVAVGVAFVTYSGHFADLSVPGIMALSGIVAVETLRHGIVVSIAAGLLAGLLIGAINAFAVGKIRANPIIWTLAVAFTVNGFLRWLHRGGQIYPELEAGEEIAAAFLGLSRINVLNISIMVWVFVAMVIIGQILLTKTKFGVQLKMVGSAYKVAKMTGVDVARTVGIAYMLSALAASIGGIFLTSLVQIGAFYNGAGFDFGAVTVVVIGGITLAGGRGSIVSVLGGAFAIGLMDNIMTLVGIDTFSQNVARGVVFIFIVWVHSILLRKLGEDDA